MMTSRLLLSLAAAVVLGGIARAGEFSLGGAHLLAQAASPVSVTSTFAERPGALHDATEGSDTTCASPGTRTMRGADGSAAASCTDQPTTTRTAAHKPAPVPAEPIHGPAITPAAAAIRHPSYRWQSLVPGTIR